MITVICQGLASLSLSHPPILALLFLPAAATVSTRLLHMPREAVSEMRRDYSPSSKLLHHSTKCSTLPCWLWGTNATAVSAVNSAWIPRKSRKSKPHHPATQVRCSQGTESLAQFLPSSESRWVRALTRNMLSPICDVNIIVAWNIRNILGAAAPILVIFTANFRLWRSFNSYSKATNSCPSARQKHTLLELLASNSRFIAFACSGCVFTRIGNAGTWLLMPSLQRALACRAVQHTLTCIFLEFYSQPLLTLNLCRVLSMRWGSTNGNQKDTAWPFYKYLYWL